MRWFQNADQWVRRQMAGRYGVDALGRALSIGGLAALVLALAAQLAGAAVSSLLAAAAFALILWCYIRIFSRNMQKRSAENQRYMALQSKVGGWLRLKRDCFTQRKDYAFFRCPSCRQMVRVPKGKGRIRITCRKCGFAFEKKT